MYFQFSDYYKRDVYFVFSEEKNMIDKDILENGKKIDENIVLIFEIDKIDKYINSYDLLPTYTVPLVSNRFKNVFNNLSNDIQFIKATVADKNGNENNNFYCMNILNILPVFDKIKSKYEYKKYGDAEILKIKSLFIIKNSLKDHSIIRMKEHLSYIIVTEEFKNCCTREKLTGINFLEEGFSIYNE